MAAVPTGLHPLATLTQRWSAGLLSTAPPRLFVW